MLDEMEREAELRQMMRMVQYETQEAARVAHVMSSNNEKLSETELSQL